jgi:adenylosuccinate lyase
VAKLRVNQEAIARNMSIYGPFAATERVLMALVKAGADRQSMHERVRVQAMQAWEQVNQGKANPLADLLCQDGEMNTYLSPDAIRGLMAAEAHVGNAPEKARKMAGMIREKINS